MNSPAQLDETLKHSDGRIPVSLLTGFLGAGKTTILNKLMKNPAMSGVALLINEFGDVGIDHHLVETIDESTVLLDSGCLCCSVQGDLIRALKELHLRSSKREIPPITRVVIETTGLADPVPVIYTLMEERFVAARFVCDGVLTAVDATHGYAQLSARQEAIRQVAMADRLLITKCDLVSSGDLSLLRTRLEELNPGALQLEVCFGDIDASKLFGCGIYATGNKLPDVATWLGEERIRNDQTAPNNPSHQASSNEGNATHSHAHSHRTRHDSSVSSFVVQFDQPVPWHGFALAMGHILQDYGSQLLRVKGLANIEGEELPWVIHCVQNVAYPAIRLNKWPDRGPFEDRRGRLVFIAHGLLPEQRNCIYGELSHFSSKMTAIRESAANPFLPTRCWFSEKLIQPTQEGLKVEGWVVQPIFLSRRQSIS